MVLRRGFGDAWMVTGHLEAAPGRRRVQLAAAIWSARQHPYLRCRGQRRGHHLDYAAPARCSHAARPADGTRRRSPVRLPARPAAGHPTEAPQADPPVRAPDRQTHRPGRAVPDEMVRNTRLNGRIWDEIARAVDASLEEAHLRSGPPNPRLPTPGGPTTPDHASGRDGYRCSSSGGHRREARLPELRAVSLAS
jgi:hypothetical protein